MSLTSSYVRSVRIVRRFAEPTGVLSVLEGSRYALLRYVRSLFAIHDAVDMAALDLAWWSYASISEVERFLASRPAARVFEFGAGASTAWLARRAASVQSVEHDAEFIDVARRITAPFDNVRLTLVAPQEPETPGRPEVASARKGWQGLEFAEYATSIERAGGQFDLIVIDGRARVECLRRSLPHLNEDGMILFDDVGRRRYASALSMPGLEAQVFRGRTPAMPIPTATALMRRRTS
jgi:hypothetical protein